MDLRWQPGYVYPPVFYPPHVPLDAPAVVVFALVFLAVGALTLRRPADGLAALIVLTPFAFAHYLGGTSITLSKAALLGFAAGLLRHRPALGALRDPLVVRLGLAIGAVIAAMLLSSFGAGDEHAVLREVAKWLEYGATFAAATVALANDPDDRPIWRAIATASALVSVLAIAQEFVGAPAGVFVHGQPFPRIAGPLEGPNQLSAWLGIAIPVLLARVLVHRDWRLVAVLVLAVVVDVLTLSRSGIVAVAIACAIVLIATRPPRAVRLRFAAGGVALAVVLVTLGTAIGLEARFFSLAEVAQADHLGTRSELWRAAIDLWRSSPVVGIGAGNYELDLGRVGLPDVRTHANSLYLQSLAETGAIGFLATLGLVYVSIQTFAQAASRRPLIVGALGASAALALHQVFDYLVFFPKIGVFWWLILAVGVVEVLQARNDARPLEAAA
jgi:O-antigen ligase